MPDFYLDNIPDFVKGVNNAVGGGLYIVGGWVRNGLLGLPASDIDLAGSLTAEELSSRLGGGAAVRTVSRQLGTCHIIIDGKILEYTPFRTERYNGGEHSPYSVEFTGDMKADAMRRDFACNALYCRIEDGLVIDLVGGRSDIESGIMRAVIEPARVFSADGLRLMRLVRQAAELGLEVEDKTWEYAKRNKRLIKDISAERVREELDRVLNADLKYGVEDGHYRGLKLIGSLGLWEYILPELEMCRGVEQNPKFHRYDVYGHTLQAVKGAPPRVRLAALMHDLGKPVALMQDGNMYRHAIIGAEIARERLGQKGLKYKSSVVEKTVRLVANHMYDLGGNTGETKLRRFVARNHDIADELCELIGADGQATGMADGRPCRIADMYRQMQAEGIPFELKGLDINGGDIVGQLDIAPQNIGVLLNELHDRVITLRLKNNKEQLLNCAKQLVKSKDFAGKTDKKGREMKGRTRLCVCRLPLDKTGQKKGEVT